MNDLNIREADRVEITTLVDNYADLFLADSSQVKRLRVAPPLAVMAEPGLSVLITVQSGEEKHTVLMDGGITSKCLAHNTQVLSQSLGVLFGEVTGNIDLVEDVVLSHGHFDHFGGLLEFLSQGDKAKRLTLHADAFVERRFNMGAGTYINMPGLDREALFNSGAAVNEITGPTTLANDMILVSGTVKRTVDFETGSPELEAKLDGEWVHDPFTDDMGLAVKIKNQGLVVIDGCSHAGIVNTVKYFQEQTNTEKVHAVYGGFHLSGKNESKIDPTIKAMQEIAPDYIVPTHCTGWEAIRRFSLKMPEQFILNSAGTTFIFTG